MFSISLDFFYYTYWESQYLLNSKSNSFYRDNRYGCHHYFQLNLLFLALLYFLEFFCYGVNEEDITVVILRVESARLQELYLVLDFFLFLLHVGNELILIVDIFLVTISILKAYYCICFSDIFVFNLKQVANLADGFLGCSRTGAYDADFSLAVGA